MTDCLNRVFYLSRSCQCERNVHQDTATANFMGNQVGCVKSAMLVSGLALTDCDGFHRGQHVCRVINSVCRVECRIDLIRSRLLLDNVQ